MEDLFFFSSTCHRMIWVVRDLKSHPVLTLCRDSFHQTRLPKAPSDPIFSSSKDGASTASLGNLFHCLTTFIVKNALLISNVNLLLCLIRFISNPNLSLHALVKRLTLYLFYKPSLSIESLQLGLPRASLESKQPPLSQPLFIGEMLQPPDNPCGSPLHQLQPWLFFLMLRALELNTVLKLESHKNREQRENHLLQSSGHAAYDAAQYMIGFLGCNHVLAAHVQFFICVYPQVLLHRITFSPFIPRPYYLAVKQQREQRCSEHHTLL